MKRRRLFISICSFLGVSLLATTLGIKIHSAMADGDVSLVGTEINERYDLNSIIDFKSTDRLSYNGSQYEINEIILKYPDGAKVKSNSFALNELGNYSLSIVHDNSITLNKEFKVNGNYLSYSNEKTVINYDTLNANFSQKGYNQGLSISAAEGDFITFKKPINVYENDITKLIYFNLVQMDQKVKNIDIRLTDCYNPDIYLDILYKRGSKEILTYVSLSAMGQKDAGLDKEQNGLVTIGDDNYTVSPYGGTIMDSNNPVSGNYNNFMFYLDTSDRSRIKVIAETDIVYKKCIISELNNPAIYAYNFPGFTNGNVYLSIAANNYEGVESAKIEIAEACGLTGEGLAYLIGNAYSDSNAPFFISTLGDSVHQIRSGVSFKIPEIQAVDDTGIRGKSDCAVWYNYDSNAKYMVSVEDGKFLPNNLGFYSLIYTATDYFGNVGNYRVDLVATSGGTSGIDFKFNGLGDIIAGKSYYLNQYTAKSLNGDVTVTIEVTDPKGNVERLKNVGSLYYVKYAGDYSVKYILEDCFYTDEYLTTFKSVSSGKPIFDKNKINASFYYIKGAEYSIENVKAYLCSENEPVLSNVESFVSFDGGSFIACDRERVTVSGNYSIQFKYVANGDETTAIYSDEARIVDVNYGTANLNLGNYFASECFSIKNSDEYGLTLSASESGNGATIDFVNKLFLSAFSMKMKISDTSTMDRFDIVLTDYFEKTNKIKVSLETYEGNSTFISINDEPLTYIETSWKGCDIDISSNDKGNINLTFSKVNSFNRTESYSYTLTNSVSLTNQYFLLSFIANNFVANDSISISTIMKQRFDVNTTVDSNSGIALIDQIETIATLDSVVTIPVLYFVDVLSPCSDSNAKLTVSQISPTSRILNSTDGVALKNITDFYDGIQIKLDAYGKYQISYSFMDGAGNNIKTSELARIRPVISVLDEVAPTISLSKNTQNAKTGEAITPLEANVSDNYSDVSKLTIYYFVCDAQGAMCAFVKKGSTFTLSKAGTYTVYVNCVDECGNSSYVIYTLNVK